MTEWLRVTYRVRSPANRIEARARSIALEQSVEMGVDAVTDTWVLEHVVGRVEEVTQESDLSYRVVIELSAITVGDNPAQLLSMLFGNVSLQDDVDLVDVVLPPSILHGFHGPNHGIEGLRSLTAVPQRPLTCTALKPQGAPTAALAELGRQLAEAGINIIKDDHGLADQSTSPFIERVKACQHAIESSGTGALYAPSAVGTPRQVAQGLHVAANEGVRVVLIAPMIYGLPAFGELVQDHPDLVFLAHPAFAGTSRIAPALLFGKLFRLYGADAVIYPNYGGRFAYTPAECTAVALGARASWHTFRSALPVPAGGMSVDRVEEIVDFYGPDVMLLISGDLLASPDVARQAERFVQAVQS